MKKIFLLILLLTIVVRTAFAEDSSVLTGVVATSTIERITAPYAGEVISLLFREGDAVTAGMEAATMSPNIVRAPCSGTVTLFAGQGNDCIGSGTLARIDPVPCTGEGLVVSEVVGSGMHVEVGDELYELAPTWDAHFVMHETSGVVAEVCVQEGDWGEAGETIALVWPDEAMRVILHVPEMLLDDYAWSRTVSMVFADGRETRGCIDWVSMIPDISTGLAVWEAHASPESTKGLRYGMCAQVFAVE